MALADTLAFFSLVRAWLLLVTPTTVQFAAVAIVGAAILFAMNVEVISQIVRIMLYLAALLAWLLASPASGNVSFLLLCGLIWVLYALLRQAYRYSRTLFWSIAVLWCLAALGIMAGLHLL